MPVYHIASNSKAYGYFVGLQVANPVCDENAALAQWQLHDRIAQTGEASRHIQCQIGVCVPANNVCGLFFRAGKQLRFKMFAPKPIETEIDRSAREKGA
ncbi:hypothetical protein D9M69_700070 [compost metagenome]